MIPSWVELVLAFAGVGACGFALGWASRPEVRRVPGVDLGPLLRRAQRSAQPLRPRRWENRPTRAGGAS